MMRRCRPNYNGFTYEERLAALTIQRRARAGGQWRYPRVCEMCGLSRDRDGACIIAHNEDYRRPLEVHPVCVECHERLHRRFDQPNVWVRYIMALRAGHRPPAWRSFMQFRARGGDGSDVPDAPPFEPDRGRWWECLSMRDVEPPGQGLFK